MGKAAINHFSVGFHPRASALGQQKIIKPIVIFKYTISNVLEHAGLRTRW
jgi:hypothetical protein